MIGGSFGGHVTSGTGRSAIKLAMFYRPIELVRSKVYAAFQCRAGRVITALKRFVSNTALVTHLGMCGASHHAAVTRTMRLS